MPYTFDDTNVYGVESAVVRGDLTEKDVSELLEIRPIAMAMNGAFGWTGNGLELVPKLESLRRLSLLPYRPIDVSCLAAAHFLESLNLGSNTIGKLNLQGMKSLNTFGFYDTARRLRFTGLSGLHSLEKIGGNPSVDMLNTFAEVPHLKKLNISTRFENLEWLKAFKLDALSVDGATKLTNLSGIETQKDLFFLKFCDNRRLTSVAEIAECPSIKVLLIDEISQIGNLDGINALPNLELLSFIGDTNIVDGRISILDQSPKLAYVRFVDRKHYDKKKDAYTFDQKVFESMWDQYFGM